jgi:hypothetical protein
MSAGQWIALSFLVLIIAALVFAFARHGVAIKPDADLNPPTHPPGSS